MNATILAALALLGLAGGATAAETRPAAEQQNLALVEGRFAAWSAGSGSPYELLADDVRWTIHGRSLAARTYPGREAFLAEVIRPFNARMRVGLKPVIHAIHADGDVVVIRFDAAGEARDGTPYVNSYAWFLTLQDGRITEASAFFDAIAFDELWTRVAP